jgi:hypothetical protein
MYKTNQCNNPYIYYVFADALATYIVYLGVRWPIHKIYRLLHFFLFNYYIDLSFDTFVFDTRFAARKLLL